MWVIGKVADAIDGVLDRLVLKESSAPSAITGHAQVWANSSGQLLHIDSSGNYCVLAPSPVFKSYALATGVAGTSYAGGFYEASAADANLTNVSATVNYGTAGVGYGAHAFLVAGGAGTTDAGTVSIVVSGTSITDAGVRTPADSETIVADVTAMTTDAYYETEKKWLGTITYTLTGAGGASVFAADFNYGFAKYEDFGNKQFRITDFEVVFEAGNVADTSVSFALLHHSATGWTYHATAFVPGNGVVVSSATDYATDDNTANSQSFAYKRAGLSKAVDGAASEGVVVKITTSAVNTIEHGTAHVGIRYV